MELHTPANRLCSELEEPLELPPLPLEIWEKILRSANGVDWLKSVWRQQDMHELQRKEAEEKLASVRAAASESMDVFDTFCEVGGLDSEAEGRRNDGWNDRRGGGGGGGGGRSGGMLSRFSQSTEVLLGGSSGGRSGAKTLEDVDFTFRLHGRNAAPPAEAPARLLAPKRGLPMGALWESSSEDEDDDEGEEYAGEEVGGAGGVDRAEGGDKVDAEATDDFMLPSDDEEGDDSGAERVVGDNASGAMGPRVYSAGGRTSPAAATVPQQPACPDLVAALTAQIANEASLAAANPTAAAGGGDAGGGAVGDDGRLPPACEMFGTRTDRGVYVEGAPLLLQCSCPKVKCKLCDADVAECNATDHKEVCSGRVVGCPVCQRRVKHSCLAAHLSSGCKRYAIACFDCTIPTSRMKLARHREEWHCAVVPAAAGVDAEEETGAVRPSSNATAVVLGSTYKDHLNVLQCPARAHGCRFRTEDRVAWDKHWAHHCAHRQMVCLSCKKHVEWGKYDAHYASACTGPRQRPTLMDASGLGGDGSGRFDPAAVLGAMLKRRKPFHDPLTLEHGTFVIPKNPAW